MYNNLIKESFLEYPPSETELDEFEFIIRQDKVEVLKNGSHYETILLKFETNGFRFRFLNMTEKEIEGEI